nr:hypothetical protein [Duganella aceris]
MALQAELAQGALELPPCTSLEEWHAFRAGLNQLMYTRYGVTVDDCVPVDLGERVDFADVLKTRAQRAAEAEAAAIAASAAKAATTAAAPPAAERAIVSSAAGAPVRVATPSSAAGEFALAAATHTLSGPLPPAAATPVSAAVPTSFAAAPLGTVPPLDAAPLGTVVSALAAASLTATTPLLAVAAAAAPPSAAASPPDVAAAAAAPSAAAPLPAVAALHGAGSPPSSAAPLSTAQQDARALRRLFLELPALSSELRLLILPAGLPTFQQHQALLLRLGMATLNINTMPALAWAAPDQPLAAEDQTRRAAQTLTAQAALDEAWSLLARLQLADPEQWPHLLDEADRICANLETGLSLRRQPHLPRTEPSL